METKVTSMKTSFALATLGITLSYINCINAVAVWGQCGGIGYSGSTICDAGTSCVVLSDYYYQCQPGSATVSTSASSTVSSTSAASSATGIPRDTFTEITNFGSNPTNVQNFVYVPSTLAAKPGLVLAIHWCGGTAEAFYAVGVQNLAAQYGFIVMYPDAPDPSQCWDVHTNATLTHDAGGDSLGIISGARYLTSLYGVDTSKVFAMGLSSGAMMTNVLAGAYPDIIRATSIWAGVPYGCFAGPDMWETDCALGLIIKTPQEWGDLARSGYPGYTGPRPKMQLWHGSVDTVLYTQNFQEEIKQWTNVLNVSQTPTATTPNWPLANWTRTDYGPNIQAVLATGVDHSINMQFPQIMQWFGFA